MRRIFLRQLLRYASIAAVLAACCLFLLWQTFQASRQTVIQSVRANAAAGLTFLDDQTRRVQVIASNLLQNEYFHKAILIRGTPRPDEMIYLKRVQELIKQYVLANQMDEDVLLLFRENQCLLTMNLCTDRLAPSYPALFRYGDLEADAFHQYIFSSLRPEKDSATIFSHYAFDRSYNALVAFAEVRVAGAEKPVCVLGLTTRAQRAAAAFLPPDQIFTASLLITSADGRTLLSWNTSTAGQDGAPGGAGVVMPGPGGMTAVITIPRAYIMARIWPATLSAMLVVLGGILVAVLAALLHSLRAARALHPAWSAAQAQVGDQPRRQSEYTYISGAFQQMDDTNREQASHIYELKQSAVHLAMAYLMTTGARTRQEEMDLEALVERDFRSFRVLTIGHEGKPQPAETLPQLAQQWIAHHLPGVPVLSINARAQEAAVILFAPSGGLAEPMSQLALDVQAMLPGRPSVHVGVSRQASGVQQVRLAYLEASHALYTGHTPSQSGARLYDGSVQDSQPFDLSLLIRLNDLILAGDADAVRTHISEHIAQAAPAALPPHGYAQRYYLLRQVLQNIAEAFPKDILNEPLPPFRDNEDGSVQMAALARFALLISQRIAARHVAGNTQQKQRTEQFIRENAANPALNAALIARHTGISEKYVFTLIKEQTGRSLGQFLTDVRLDMAASLLMNSDAPVSAVWEKAGFGSENTFYRAFLKRTGQSPARWRAARQAPSTDTASS